MPRLPSASSPFFFSHTTSPTEIYTLSLHDALPIWGRRDLETAPGLAGQSHGPVFCGRAVAVATGWLDRKSTRLNSSHQIISYAVFCLKKKTNQSRVTTRGMVVR